MVVYLDNSATTKPYRESVETMVKVMREDFGNPSSLHTMGIEAEKYVRRGRRSFAASIGAGEDEVYFTSCGTESDNTALLGVAQSKHRQGKKIITTKVEHPAIMEPARKLEAMGFKIEYVGVDKKCRLDVEHLKSELTEDTILISVMAVNNETGTIMPLEEIAKIKDDFNRTKGTNILLHTDAVQGYGKIHIYMNGNFKGVDLMSVSGHKIHGPKGIGGLYVRKGVNVTPFMIGGGQERHFRSGTENTPAIAAFGEAIDIAHGKFENRIKAMIDSREYLLKGIGEEIKDILINTPEGDESAPSVLNVSFLGTRGEVLLHSLEQEGIYVSTGSACSSNKKGQSHVLGAMGLSHKEIEGAIRFSFSEFNTVEEMDYVVDKLKSSVMRFRKLGSFR